MRACSCHVSEKSTCRCSTKTLYSSGVEHPLDDHLGLVAGQHPLVQRLVHAVDPGEGWRIGRQQEIGAARFPDRLDPLADDPRIVL